jgi:outer membrane protein assembly factor BamB
VKRPLVSIGILLLGATGSGCGLIGGDKSNVEPPAELVDIEPTVRVRQLWSHHIGGSAERLRLGLAPTTDGARIYAGTHDGQVAAMDAQTGREIWTTDTELELGAGPAFGDGMLVFGTNNGELVALDAETGEQRWLSSVGSEVLAPPAVGGGVVVYRTVDGRLRAVRGTDGSALWSIEQSMPALTLRGNSAPLIAGDLVVSGFDNGRVGAYRLDTGETQWEMAIAAPAGRTELERLVDVAEGLKIVGNDVYVASYQGRAVGIDLTTGLVLWQRELSSFAGLGADGNNVYVTNDVGAVMALDRRGGQVRWTQEALRLRDVSAPARYLDAVVVGDFEGYLHWINPSDGAFMARVRGANDRITAAPLVVGATLVVQGDDGSVSAFEVSEEPA